MIFIPELKVTFRAEDCPKRTLFDNYIVIHTSGKEICSIYLYFLIIFRFSSFLQKIKSAGSKSNFTQNLIDLVTKGFHAYKETAIFEW